MDPKLNLYHLSTRTNHPDKIILKEGNVPIVPPLYQTAKFAIAPGTLNDQYVYTRVSNPTLRQLEMTLAEVQRQEDCVVVGSGMAAISGALLGVLKAGDHVITFRETYKPARVFIRDVLPRYGITSTVLTLNDEKALTSAIQPGKTKAIYFESPSNPNLVIADLSLLKKVARENNVLLILDATFGGLHQHTDAADLLIHSLTKYANGHGDVIAGSIAGKKSLINAIKPTTILLGATLDPHAAFLVDRGLKTYSLRFERQCQTTATVAKFLSEHGKVKRVYYPGLATHPGHDLAKKQMTEMGAIVSFEIEGDATEFCHKLKLVTLAVSLGSSETLIAPTMIFFGDDLSEKDKQEMGLNAHSLRLSVGLEHSEDLIQDLSRALS